MFINLFLFKCEIPLSDKPTNHLKRNSNYFAFEG